LQPLIACAVPARHTGRSPDDMPPLSYHAMTTTCPRLQRDSTADSGEGTQQSLSANGTSESETLWLSERSVVILFPMQSN
jgi:hypothetical protein